MTKDEKINKMVVFLDKLYWAKNYIQLLTLYCDKEQSEKSIKEYEDEEFEYLLERWNTPEDIKKGFKYAKNIAKFCTDELSEIE